MGSPPAPCLANGWLSKYDQIVKGDAKIFSRYMDDILRDIKSREVDAKLNEINDLHPNLKFTIERENNNSLPFLDMKIIHSENGLSSTWYTKSTDTGLTLNFHALAPSKYKRSVVSGMVYRIFNACSSWQNFHLSLQKAKKMLENNQYPVSFYEPIIEKTINNILKDKDDEKIDEDEKKECKLIFVQYRGKVTERFEHSLKQINAPCKVITTTKKLKNVLPSLKPGVEKAYKSGLVYKITCSRCSACYVGQTLRHLLTRISEHKNANKPVGKHFKECNQSLTMNDVEVLATSIKSSFHLLTLEALFIKIIKPTINTKDEYKRRTLSIKI